MTPINTKKFILTNIQWLSLDVDEIRPDRNVCTIKGHIKSCSATCKACDENWLATETGSGRIRYSTQAFSLTCPKCSETEWITTNTCD